jgi:UDP-2,3-diacylglucosamine hydrolase
MTADAHCIHGTVRPLGILAGGGRLPEQIAESIVARGGAVHIVAIEGEAEPEIARFPHTWVNWGAIGRMTASLKAAGASDLIIVGRVTRPDWRKVRPDLGLVRAIPTIIQLFGGGDDHVLRNVVRFFETQGFTVRGVADLAPELLMPGGALGRVAPGPAFLADADRGFALIEALGASDVGQAVVMRNGGVLAIEAAEGTDRMLVRLADDANRRASGGVLVKGPKPGQELRVDMPVIGPRTIELAGRVGLAGIMVASGRVLVADRSSLIAAADVGGMFVAGVDVRDGPVPEHSSSHVVALSQLTRRTATPAVRRDMARALDTLAATAPFAAALGVVVVRRHVIAIESGEGLAAMFARTASLRQWGATVRSTRRGALALAAAGCDAATLDRALRAAAATGLAGVVLSPGFSAELADRAGHIAGSLGLAVSDAKGHWPTRS